MSTLKQAVKQMEATFARTDPTKALRTWRQGAQKALLGQVVSKSRGTRGRGR